MCDYCTNKGYLYRNSVIDVIIDVDDCCINIDTDWGDSAFDIDIDININYCPKCGRKLN